MPGKYPFLAPADRLFAATLDLALESSAGAAPPSSPHGNAHEGKLWLDTSVSPAQLRLCAVPDASPSFVAGEWFSLGPVTPGAGLGDPYMPLQGNSTKTGNLAVTGNLSAQGTLTVQGAISTQGDLGAQGSLHLAGPYIYPGGGAGNVNGTGGPFIYADTNNIVLHVGTGNGSILLQDDIGAQRISFTPSSGIIDAEELILAGNYVTFSGAPPSGANATGGPFIYGDNNYIIAHMGSGDLGFAVENYTGTGVFTVSSAGDVSAISKGYFVDVILSGAYLTFEGAVPSGINGTGGPFIYADTGNMVFKLGSSASNWLFQDYNGTNIADLNVSGNLVILGPYLYFMGQGGGSVNGTGGPFIYGDNNDIVAHLGSGNVAFLVQNYSGGAVFSADGAGDASVFGSFTVGSNATIGGSLTVDGNAQVNGSLQVDSTVTIESQLTLTAGGNALVVATGGILTNQGCQFNNLNLVGTSDICLHIPSGGATMGDILPNADHNGSCGSATQAWAQAWSYNYGTASDAALKTDITELPSCADLVAAISPRRYCWREGDDRATHWGFIAQEVGAAMKGAGHKFGGHLRSKKVEGLAYNELLAVLWKACQELQARVSELEAR